MGDHRRLEQGCTLTEGRLTEGVTVETWQSYRKEKKERQKSLDKELGEGELWCLLFEVIFPNETIPSPCKQLHLTNH
jgi:hypothetical protein